ncbi:MAG: response regulator [Candidatus Omnitrophota bacterium]
MSQIKLLTVDDEQGIVEFIAKIYARKGFLTFSATDGVTAVDIFNKEHPQIVLLDVHMPYSPIDGVETLKRIKEIDKQAVCIMLTRITDKDKVEAARKLGALHYITKPLELEDLDKVVMEAKNLAENIQRS